ncbi:MAG: heparinase [Acetobacter sp.]|nr:heparinase [Acetobacter sp.]
MDHTFRSRTVSRGGQLIWLVFIFGLVLIASVADSVATASEGILSRGMTAPQLRELLLAAPQWHPFPRLRERAGGKAVPVQVRDAYVQEAIRALDQEWLLPKATDFLEFFRTGDRSKYEAVSFGRRKRLAALVLGEVFENKGRFLDEIVNGIWTIAEETYWGIPATVDLQCTGPGLPDVTEPMVDLFAAETASLLAWTSYLLKDSLDRISPLVNRRIVYEVDRRIITVNLARNDFWWMGGTGRVNNWTPWICSNWLTAVLLLEEDPERRARSVHKILVCLDRFLQKYADDGGCDEGPGYWGRAGGSLFDCLELLYSATQGRIDGFRHPRVREIGRFIARIHIHGPWFVNFADASAKPFVDAPTIYRFGKAIGDSTLTAFGVYLAREQGLGKGSLGGQFGILGRVLPALFVLGEMLEGNPQEPLLRDAWFPGIQVMTARSTASSYRGLFVAAQGGHNAESHNHNDVGNFIVYANGEPVIIDIGVETYTAKTFSNDRYTIWTMQSAYHNVPTINGVSQGHGRQFCARQVGYAANDSAAWLSMDIAPAYPPAAAVKSWQRRITLLRGREIVIHDTFDLEKVRENAVLTLMTRNGAQVAKPGLLVLATSSHGAGGAAVEVAYEPACFDVTVERIGISDPQLRASWGDTVARVRLTMKHTPARGESILRIRQTE